MNAPLVQTAADHVIFSKKLLVIIASILVLTGLAFFWIEQARIMKYNAVSRTTAQQNNAMKVANEQLEKAKLDMQAEEDELVNMYSQWLDNESKDLQSNQENLAKLKDKFKSVQGKISQNSKSLSQKSSSLDEQDKRLKAYQFKIQQKQAYVEQLETVLKALNSTVPAGTGLDEPPGDVSWEDEFGDGFDLSSVDDDWMNDEGEY